jgi:hypothetical protein
MTDRKPTSQRLLDWLIVGLGVLIFVLMFLLMVVPCFQGMGA